LEDKVKKVLICLSVLAMAVACSKPAVKASTPGNPEVKNTGKTVATTKPAAVPLSGFSGAVDLEGLLGNWQSDCVVDEEYSLRSHQYLLTVKAGEMQVQLVGYEDDNCSFSSDAFNVGDQLTFNYTVSSEQKNPAGNQQWDLTYSDPLAPSITEADTIVLITASGSADRLNLLSGISYNRMP
jgi:hypothetical protein